MQARELSLTSFTLPFRGNKHSFDAAIRIIELLSTHAAIHYEELT